MPDHPLSSRSSSGKRRAAPAAFLSLLILLVHSYASPEQARASLIRVPADHPTIQPTIDRSQQGDTILVSPGIYEENINFYGKSLYLSSTKGPDSTFLRALLPEAPAITLASGEDSTTTIRGLTITSKHKQGGGAILCKGSSPAIMHNRIVANSVGDREAAGIALEGPECSPLIIGNTFDRNHGPVIGGVDVDSALIDRNLFIWNTPRSAVIELSHSKGIRITGNVIHNNESPAMGFSLVDGLVIDHNTVVLNHSHGTGALSFFECTEVFVTNSIVAFDLGAYTMHWSRLRSGFDLTVKGNCLYGITLGSCSGFNPDPSQNFFTNPFLCVIDDQTFSLAENSPCIAAGVDRMNVGAPSAIGCQGHLPVSGPPKPPGFTGAEQAPMLLNNGERLQYPEVAIQMGASGTVWIEAFIDRDGHVTQARVLKSSRTGLGFEESALHTAYRRVYRPAIHKDSPVAVWITFEIDFDYQWWEKNEKGIIFDMD